MPSNEQEHTDNKSTDLKDERKQDDIKQNEDKPSSDTNEYKKETNEEENDDDDDEEEEESDEENPLFAQLASKYNLKVDEKELEDEEVPEDRVNTANSKIINISEFNQRYNSKQRSALTSILVEYGMPDADEHRYKRSKKKVKKTVVETDEWEDRESEREKTKTDYFDSVYQEPSKWPAYLQEDYVDKLEEKIANQRKAIKKRSEQLERKLQERQEKHLESMRFTKKLPRHDLSHDTSFIRHIPKSNAYKLIAYENKLRSEGKLKTKADVEEFWECSKDPIALKYYMNKMNLGSDKSQTSSQPPQSYYEDTFTSSRTSSMSSITQEKERTMTDYRPLTQIEEMKEPSRPSTRDANAKRSWAVTQQFESQYGPVKPSTKRSASPLKPILSVPGSPLKRSQDPYTVAKQAAIELDKKHPMKELPPMYCFSTDVGEKQQDPEEVLKELQAERREKERRLFVKRIRKMYHLAQANKAATQRIMERRDDFTVSEDSPPTDTWLSAYDLEDKESLDLTEEEKFLKSHPWLHHVRHRAIVTIAEESEPPSGYQSQKTSASLVRQRSGKRTGSKLSRLPSREEVRPPALSIDALGQNGKVVEPKCLSTLWTNYLGVGKSIFAK